MNGKQSLWLMIGALLLLLGLRLLWFQLEKDRPHTEAKSFLVQSGERLMAEYSKPKDNIWFQLKGLDYDSAASNWHFPDSIQALEDSVILIKGYIYPFEKKEDFKHFGLSALPTSNCYFCGKGGPESVMEVYARKPLHYTKRAVWFRGRLKLNDNDRTQLPYVLEEAVKVSE